MAGLTFPKKPQEKASLRSHCKLTCKRHVAKDIVRQLKKLAIGVLTPLSRRWRF
jgi:hypothetical protein